MSKFISVRSETESRLRAGTAILAAFLVTLGATTTPAQSATRDWTNGSGDNSWFTPGNWETFPNTPGVPTSADQAQQNSPGTSGNAVVVAAPGAVAGILFISAGNTVNVTGNTATLSVSDLLNVGFITGPSAFLNVLNGGAVQASRMYIGGGVGGQVVVSGAGSSLTVSPTDVLTTQQFSIGDVAAGSLRVENGAAVTVLGSGILHVGNATVGGDGTLQIGNGGASGTVMAASIDFGTAASQIVFNQTDTVTLTAPISGAGSLSKNAAGTAILNGANSYTGITTVNGGTLSVNGSIASSLLTTVNAGGTLGGNGIVGNTFVNGGTLAPGNSIGLLTVQGSLAFTAAASYLVEVSPANADRVNVTGVASLNGATVNASFAPGSYVSRQYTIVNAAGGVNGTFGATAVTNLPANFHTGLSYDANNVYLDLALNFAVPSNLNVNQRNVANALTSFFNTTGGIPLVFGALSPAGLTQASGEIGTGSQRTTFDAMNMFMGVMTDPFAAGRGDPASSRSGAFGYADEALNYASKRRTNDALAAIHRKAPVMAETFAQRWSVWAAGYGGSQTTDGNAALGSNTATSRVYGTAVGADYRFSPDTLAGFALAGGGTNFSIANGLGSGRSDLFQAGAFIRHHAGPAYISAALAYGWQDITTDRTVIIAGIDQLRAKFNANAWSGRVEAGYRLVAQGIGVTPYAAGQFTTFELPGYAESVVSGANTFALAYGAKSVTASRSELGLRSDKSFAMPDGIFTLRGRAAWAHDFNADRTIAATFQTLPGASFVVNGAAQARDAALATGSAEMKWLNGFSLAATFEGEFSDVTRSYAGKGVARYAW
jgi:autotransporter-associated beta strand protein